MNHTNTSFRDIFARNLLQQAEVLDIDQWPQCIKDAFFFSSQEDEKGAQKYEASIRSGELARGLTSSGSSKG